MALNFALYMTATLLLDDTLIAEFLLPKDPNYPMGPEYGLYILVPYIAIQGIRFFYFGI